MTTKRIHEKLAGFSKVPIEAFDELMLIINKQAEAIQKLTERVATLERAKMKHIPSIYKRKAERASYAAGYRAGYSGRGAETLSLARHQDLRPMYEHGYDDGRGDREGVNLVN